MKAIQNITALILVTALAILLASCEAEARPPSQTPTAEPAVAKGYGRLILSPNAHRTYEDVWNLTKGDLILRYNLDLSGVKALPDEATAWTNVGVTGGAEGILTSGCPRVLYQTPNLEDYIDKHYLKEEGRLDELSYNATAPDRIGEPIGTYDSYGIWFDRDGIYPDQADNWGMIDRKTYNTGGKYSIEIVFHAINSTKGTMFAKINGVETGFYNGDWLNAPPDIYPAGKSISGDLTKLRIRADQWAPDNSYGNAILSDVTVTGFLAMAEPK